MRASLELREPMVMVLGGALGSFSEEIRVSDGADMGRQAQEGISLFLDRVKRVQFCLCYTRWLKTSTFCPVYQGIGYSERQRLHQGL